MASVAYERTSFGQYFSRRLVLAKTSAQTISPFTATTTPTAFRSRSCLIVLSYCCSIGRATESTFDFTSLFCMTFAYEVVSASALGGVGAPACTSTVTDWVERP